MTLRELTRLVALGEGPRLEFKRRVPHPARMAKEIVAFANTNGGHLLLGVADDGTILGVRDAGEEEFSLRQALERHCTPAVSIQVERIEVTRRRDVIVVHVPESAAKPHFVVNNGQASATAYVRVADMSVEASAEKVQLMRAERSPAGVQFTFGEKELLLMRYLEQYGRITVAQFAQLAHLTPHRASQTLVLMTRAGVLLLHTNPGEDYFTLAYEEEG
ncbi:ATP-binding protein [Rhodocaloribacter litoris]|uniref:AlbA family DNA-binding domain-containing protein n=1 Tax=Rhodocaloribacter litoris TaxID=2558931 RepID=UPI00141F650C|nr:ATP-binding protein [Rhodocaloribacter litoris]QXD15344.1 ATP-binding protein [Rhodocaloribacter litoris]